MPLPHHHNQRSTDQNFNIKTVIMSDDKDVKTKEQIRIVVLGSTQLAKLF